MNSANSLKFLTKSRVRGYQVSNPDSQTSLIVGARVPGVWQPVTNWRSNALIVDAAVIMQKLLRNDRTGSWHVGGMYLEFDNSGSDVDPPPAVNVEDGLVYYDSLAGNPDRDYLRLPLVASAESSSDDARYPLGNVATFIAHTAGATGVHGRAFTSGLSRIYGGALVVYPNVNDAAQDLIWGRSYFDPGEQMLKMAGSQIGVTWEYTFSE